jgi:hypothetical protein
VVRTPSDQVRTTHRRAQRRRAPGVPSAGWPLSLLRKVPSCSVAHELAAQVRSTVGASARERLDIEAVVEAGGFVVDDVRMNATSGGCRGLLQPALRHGFRICVDPSPLSGGARRRRRAFVIAHEIGHSFFYDRARQRPTRLQPAGSRAEERFCNQFARALLLPPEWLGALKPRADLVFTIADQYDVSAETTARSLAASHPARPFVALAYWTRSDCELTLQWSGGQPEIPSLSPAVLFSRGRKPAQVRGSSLVASRARNPPSRQVAAVFSAA